MCSVSVRFSVGGDGLPQPIHLEPCVVGVDPERQAGMDVAVDLANVGEDVWRPLAHRDLALDDAEGGDPVWGERASDPLEGGRASRGPPRSWISCVAPITRR